MRTVCALGLVTSMIVASLVAFLGCQSTKSEGPPPCKKTLASEAGIWSVMIQVNGGGEQAGQEVSVWSADSRSLNRQIFQMTNLILTEDIKELPGGHYTSTVSGPNYALVALDGSCVRDAPTNCDHRTMSQHHGGQDPERSAQSWTGDTRDYYKYWLRTQSGQMQTINIRYVGFQGSSGP